MELRQLEAFVAVADELHFGRAAERLHVAAPTLSELVRRLEREVGTPLLTRTTRHVALTPAGSELLARAKVILDEVAAAGAAVRRIAAGDAGTVRVGVTPPAAPTQLVAFSLPWSPGLAKTAAVARFVRTALSGDPPPGWHTQAGHLRHAMACPTP